MFFFIGGCYLVYFRAREGGRRHELFPLSAVSAVCVRQTVRGWLWSGERRLSRGRNNDELGSFSGEA